MIYRPIYTNDWTIKQKEFGSRELSNIWQIWFLYTVSPNKVFCPLNVSLFKYMHLVIFKVLNLQQNVCRHEQPHSNLIWLILYKYWPQRWSVGVVLCDRVCMCLILYVQHHCICLSHHFSSDALPVCIRIMHLLSIKTGYMLPVLVLSWLDYTLLY